MAAIPALVMVAGVTVDDSTSIISLGTGDTANLATGITGMATTIVQAFFTVLPWLFLIPVAVLLIGLLKGWLRLGIGKRGRRR